MPGDHRERHAGKTGVHEEGVAVAHPAGVDGDPYVSGARLRYLTLDDLERTAGGGHLRDAIASHPDPCLGESV
jgi:hypothetical protein